jgi:hypothetical protein
LPLFILGMALDPLRLQRKQIYEYLLVIGRVAERSAVGQLGTAFVITAVKSWLAHPMSHANLLVVKLHVELYNPGGG